MVTTVNKLDIWDNPIQQYTMVFSDPNSQYCKLLYDNVGNVFAAMFWVILAILIITVIFCAGYAEGQKRLKNKKKK